MYAVLKDDNGLFDGRKFKVPKGTCCILIEKGEVYASPTFDNGVLFQRVGTIDDLMEESVNVDC